VGDLEVKIFADGADIEGIVALAAHDHIKGFTTNPTLMHKAGVTDFAGFAQELLAAIPNHPVSIEVFSDEPAEMHRQALLINGWGENANVKIPITNTRGEYLDDLLRDLAAEGVKLNVTGMMTSRQVARAAECLQGGQSSYVSLFAGRVADTGRDPIPDVVASLAAIEPFGNVELIWASPRELLNIVQAHDVGCDIITVTHDLLAKLPLLGKDLDEFSRETVQMFRNDAVAAGFQL
jgi:transaldolase